MPRRLAAYVYTGWHPIAERDRAFHPGFTEWELVRACRPRFEGHAQPRVPLLGEYDDRDPVALGRRIEIAREHGVDALVFGVFWCRGKRVFEAGLDRGFLGGALGASMPFACMWANRMPRRVLPVRRTDLPVIDDARRVPSDTEDFVEFTAMLARSYFGRPNYVRVNGSCYLSIYDSTFFVRELGHDGARAAITAAREYLANEHGLSLHLAAIDPADEVIEHVRAIGFDSVTHYVYLPRWTGPTFQDYEECAVARAEEWPTFAGRSGLPYMPSVATGWDASPRGADFGPKRPDKYPWSPVVTGESPAQFERALYRAVTYPSHGEDDLTMIASLNEWSEGHYLEPDERFGYGWLQAVANVRSRVL